MAITRRTLTELRALRAQVGELTDEAVRTTAQAWLDAWESLSPAWQAAVAALIDTATRTGRWPSSWQAARIPEVARASQATQQATQELGAVAQTAGVAAIAGVVAATLAAEPLLIASQLPAAFGFSPRPLGPTTVTDVRSYAAGRVAALGRSAAAAVQSDISRLIVRPGGPTLLDQIRGVFTGGITRSATVLRTELVDTYRAASAAVHVANGEVVTGWRWRSACDSRCCPGCWAMHNTLHPIDEPGPSGHQGCRCARLVVTKPWADLGITTTEPAGVADDAAARFRRMSRADQLAVMGPARLALLDSGHARWADLAVKRSARGWRVSYSARSVRDLQRLAGMRTPQS